MNGWKRYTKRVIETIVPSGQSVADRLPYWRNFLFAQTVIYFIPLCTIALIPGVWAGFAHNLPLVAYVDMLAFVTLLIIGFVPGIRIVLRKWLFILNLYFLSLVLLLYVGTAGPGLVYLYAVCVLAMLIFSRRYTFVWSIINLVICTGIALAIYTGYLPESRLSDLKIQSWITISANLIFLCFLTSLLISYLLGRLDRSLRKEQMLNSRHTAAISELKMKQEELEQFTAFASHNLQEPVRVVHSFITLFQRKYGDRIDKKGQQYLYYAADGTDRMKRNIKSLLDFAKIDGIQVQKEEVDLNEVIHEVKLALKRPAQQIGAQIICDHLPEIYSWRVLHFQVLYSLVGNALKYRDLIRQTKVNISVEESLSEYVFSVSDNGIGIPEEQFEKIFIIFHRLHTHEELPGTGLGLSIVQKAVSKWGGRVWVQSKKGVGSTFYYSFPKVYDS